MTTDNLAQVLREIAEEHWQAYRQPVLLSGLPRKLEEKLGDYRQILESTTLKSFIKASGNANGYRLIEHPNQKAKLGIIPIGETFEFPDVSASTIELAGFSRQDAEGFVRVLRSLTPDEQRYMSIPVGLLLKLMNAE